MTSLRRFQQNGWIKHCRDEGDLSKEEFSKFEANPDIFVASPMVQRSVAIH
jgi:hypothetical protein